MIIFLNWGSLVGAIVGAIIGLYPVITDGNWIGVFVLGVLGAFLGGLIYKVISDFVKKSKKPKLEQKEN